MLKAVFLILFFTMLVEPVFPQQIEYDIVKGGKTIGSVLAKKSFQGDTTTIKITSNAKFKLLFSFNVSYILEEKFVNGVLVSGHAINYLNDRVQKKSVVKRVTDKYIVDLDGEKSEFELNKITYSISNLYFEQPPKLDITIFSQQFSDFLPLYNEVNNTYKLESPNGNNEYFYHNEVLEKVKIVRSYATFYFKLKG